MDPYMERLAGIWWISLSKAVREAVLKEASAILGQAATPADAFTLWPEQKIRVEEPGADRGDAQL